MSTLASRGGRAADPLRCGWLRIGFCAAMGECVRDEVEAPMRAMAELAMLGPPPPTAVLTERGFSGVLMPDSGAAELPDEGWSSEGSVGSTGNWSVD